MIALIIRNHRLTEMLMFEKMGFSWEQGHNISEQIEHFQSPELFEKIDELFGFSKIYPQASLISDAYSSIATDSYFK
jgi:DtxR family Mn-dependent transcriptional regulator